MKLDKSLNTSVHVSFQNPVKTPVKVMPIDEPASKFTKVGLSVTVLHQQYKHESGWQYLTAFFIFAQVKMDGAKVSFLHVSQNVPTDSPMEVTYCLKLSERNNFDIF